MSISLMTAAFKTQLPSTQKFVLVALCDSANDQGECYPSIRALAEKCGMGERTVQEAITSLEVLGQVRRELRAGRSTVYWMTPTPAATAPRSSRTPAPAAPTPADCAPPPPQIAHPTPADCAPITINEPSIEPLPKPKKRVVDVVSADLLVMAGFDRPTAEEFIACKTDRKAPLTPRAWKDHLRESQKAGWTAQEAAEKLMAKTWKGFEARYVEGRSESFAKPAQTFRERDLAARQAEVAQWTGGRLSKFPDVIDMENGNGNIERLD